MNVRKEKGKKVYINMEAETEQQKRDSWNKVRQKG